MFKNKLNQLLSARTVKTPFTHTGQCAFTAVQITFVPWCLTFYKERKFFIDWSCCDFEETAWSLVLSLGLPPIASFPVNSVVSSCSLCKFNCTVIFIDIYSLGLRFRIWCRNLTVLAGDPWRRAVFASWRKNDKESSGFSKQQMQVAQTFIVSKSLFQSTWSGLEHG